MSVSGESGAENTILVSRGCIRSFVLPKSKKIVLAGTLRSSINELMPACSLAPNAFLNCRLTNRSVHRSLVDK